MKSLLNHSFLTMTDYTPEEFAYYLDLAEKLKQDKKAGKEIKTLEGKNFALIFEKDSTRTRCAFEVAARDQGAFTTYLGPTGSQIGKKESIADTARVLGSMFDAIEFRGFAQSAVEELSAKAGVPVWNGLTDYDHPTQTLANFLTLKEHFKKPLNQLSFAYVGHGQSPIWPTPSWRAPPFPVWNSALSGRSSFSRKMISPPNAKNCGENRCHLHIHR